VLKALKLGRSKEIKITPTKPLVDC